MDVKTRLLIGALLVKGGVCRPRGMGLGERQISVSLGSSSSVSSVGVSPTGLSISLPTSVGTSLSVPVLTSIGTSIGLSSLTSVSLSVPIPTISGSVPLPTGVSGTIPSTTTSLNWSLPTGIPPVVSTSTGFSVTIPIPTGLNTSITLAPSMSHFFYVLFISLLPLPLLLKSEPS